MHTISKLQIARSAGITVKGCRGGARTRGGDEILADSIEDRYGAIQRLYIEIQDGPDWPVAALEYQQHGLTHRSRLPLHVADDGTVQVDLEPQVSRGATIFYGRSAIAMSRKMGTTLLREGEHFEDPCTPVDPDAVTPDDIEHVYTRISTEARPAIGRSGATA